MKKSLLLFMFLCFTFSVFSSIDNPGFETIINCQTDDDPSYYPYAFEDECLGDHWKCFSDSPDIREYDVDDGYEEDDYPYGLPFEGSNYVHLHTTNNNEPGSLQEGIYYEGFEFEYGVPYNFSLAVKAIDGNITFQITVADFIIPNCGGNPNGSNGVQFIIENEVVEASDDWVVITVENFFFEENLYVDNIVDFFILPTQVVGNNDDGHFLIDAVSFEQAPCESLSCSEKTDSTACAEEGDYGYIILECAGANSYEWDFPSDSDPIEMSCGNESVILNAGEGTYSVTITGDYGCTEIREYEITPDCCVCPIPNGLGCSMDKNKIKLEWTDIPDATYNITIVKNDFVNCGCYGGGSPETITVSDWPNNNYYLNPSLYPCFSWTVSANCENGLESGNSLTYCYQNEQCYSNQEFKGTDEQPNFKSSLSPRVYPNPVSRELFFELDAPKELILSVDIYSIDGKIVKSFSKETHPNGFYKKRWSIGNQIKDGVYYIFFNTNFGTYQDKVIIQK